ncbi:alpha/beta hydrolase [Microlunatus sp. GCM10028923]|uniref:alpha/beta hydrolase n=1 Tax=Microlunatus sp. GCM10028923 TaxID=3273400 RepID=UPI00361BF296
MASKEWLSLRDTYQACAPKTVAGLMAKIMAAQPGLDLSGLDGTACLAAEPTEVDYEEVDAGGSAALWARPQGCATDRVIIYFHGGGFVSGSKDSHRKVGGHLGKAAGCLALIPDYRLAPQHPYPAQLEDARATYDWLLDQGLQPEQIAVAGDSAGGNIATALALSLHRDQRPVPGAVVAFSPWYDLEGRGVSYDGNATEDVAISRDLVHGFGPIFLGGRPPTDPLANPLYAELAGLPPVFLTYGSHETLKDSIELFAARARQAGVDVELRVGEEMQHAYQLMAGRIPEADAAIAEAGTWLRRRLGG